MSGERGVVSSLSSLALRVSMVLLVGVEHVFDLFGAPDDGFVDDAVVGDVDAVDEGAGEVFGAGETFEPIVRDAGGFAEIGACGAGDETGGLAAPLGHLLVEAAGKADHAGLGGRVSREHRPGVLVRAAPGTKLVALPPHSAISLWRQRVKPTMPALAAV